MELKIGDRVRVREDALAWAEGGELYNTRGGSGTVVGFERACDWDKDYVLTIVAIDGVTAPGNEPGFYYEPDELELIEEQK